MKKKCDNCPFASCGAGLRLRKSLMPGRWREILFSVRLGQPFYCHKTTDWDAQDDGDDCEYYRPTGNEQVCAGSLEWLGKQRR